jgi:hypothetical protein
MVKLMSADRNLLRTFPSPMHTRGISAEEWRLRLRGQLGAFAILFAVLGALFATSHETAQGTSAQVAKLSTPDE